MIACLYGLYFTVESNRTVIYVPGITILVGQSHCGNFKYSRVGTSRANVPACTTGNLQQKGDIQWYTMKR